MTLWVIGAGGGAYSGEEGAFGGGAGEVLVIDLDATEPFTYTIGERGTYGEGPVDGGDTVIEGVATAAGGKTATPDGPGDSGSGKSGALNVGVSVDGQTENIGGGGGAKTNATVSTTWPTAGEGGLGYRVADIDNPILEAFAQALAELGMSDFPFGSGGSVYTNEPDDEINAVGDGGDVNFLGTGAQEAESGNGGDIVVFWFAEGYEPAPETDTDGSESETDGSDSDSEAALPETGSPFKLWTIAGALAIMAAGTIVLLSRLSTRAEH